MNDKVNQWLAFIDDYDKGLVKVAEKKNKTLEKARMEMNYLTGDEEVRRLAELREKWDMDYNNGINYAKEKGKEEGKKEKQIEIVKEMLKKKIPISLISEITKLSVEEIEKLSTGE